MFTSGRSFPIFVSSSSATSKNRAKHDRVVVIFVFGRVDQSHFGVLSDAQISPNGIYEKILDPCCLPEFQGICLAMASTMH
jgi:hypothetical protein